MGGAVLFALLGSFAAQEVPGRAVLEAGCTLRLYEADRALERVHEPAAGQTPNLDERRAVIDWRERADFLPLEDHFVAVVTAWLDAPEAGRYAFRLTSDDGSLLTVGGERVVWNRGLHAALPLDGEVDLSAGLHALRVLMFDATGDSVLTLEWRPPGADAFEVVPAGALLTERGVTRVVAPGPKRLADDLEGLRAGDGLPLESVHPMWRLEPLRPDGFEPMVGALGLLPDGRLGVATFEPRNNRARLDEPNGTLWALSGWDNGAPEVEVVAEGLYHPLGLCAVDGAVFVAERDGIFRLEDADGDGRFETREPFATGWTSDNYHHFTFHLERDGEFLWTALSTSIGSHDEVGGGTLVGDNGPNPPLRGALLRVSLADGAIEPVAGGFRTPNGILPLGDGTALVADNQGAWKPASRIDHARPGTFHGHYNETRVRTERYPVGGSPSLFADAPPELPAVWLPQDELANSPTSLARIDSGPFAGQLLVGELKQGGLRRVCLDEVDGRLQGAAFRHSQGLEGGVNRLLWAPDGSLVVGMIGEQATWSWRGTRFGLQRLAPTGEQPFELLSARATEHGIALRFTEPAEAAALADPANYEVRQWRYRATPAYGGPKLDEEALAVAALRADDDGLGVELGLPGLAEGRCVWVRADVPSAAGEPLWSPECWVTVNRVPGRARPESAERGVLVFSRTAGFRHASIPAGVAAVGAIGAELGLPVEATEDPAAFEDANLARFRAVVFLNTTGDVLDLAQEAAFERFVRAGGGFLGVHAAADTEYDWPFYGELVGAYFASHPAVQEAVVRVLDRTHPSTAHLDATWPRTDEWYDYRARPSDAFTVLCELDEGSYAGAAMGAPHPIAWWRELDGARALYTGGGHTAEAFAEPAFRAHLAGALRFVARLGD